MLESVGSRPVRRRRSGWRALTFGLAAAGLAACQAADRPDLDPADSQILWGRLMQRGTAYRECGDSTRAAADYARAYTLHPANENLAINGFLLGDALARAGRLDDAIPVLRQAMPEIEKAFGTTHLMRAEALEALAFAIGESGGDPVEVVEAWLNAKLVRQALKDPFAFDGQLGLTHTYWRLTFPAKAGALERYRQTVFRQLNPDGRDVALGYAATGSGSCLRLTFYAFPQRDPIQAHFEGAKNAVATVRDGTIVIRSGALDLPRFGPVVEGYRAVMERPVTNGSSTRINEELIVFDMAEVRIKVRYTYPAQDQAFAEEQLQALFEAIDWNAEPVSVPD